MSKQKKVQKKHFPKISNAKLCVYSRLNNTILSLTTPNGDVVSQVSCGSCGFNNSKKSTPHALNTAINTMVSRMTDRHNVTTVDILARGYNFTVDIVSSLQKNNIVINSIEYDTCVAYGGTRRRRARRV